VRPLLTLIDYHVLAAELPHGLDVAGAEIGSGDDAMLLFFDAALSSGDVAELNTVRSRLSSAMGKQLGCSSSKAAEKLRGALARLLVGERAIRAPPAKPWRKLKATSLQDWQALWAPLMDLSGVRVAIEQQQKAATRSVEMRATAAASGRAEERRFGDM
jgi:hypothetical protein